MADAAVITPAQLDALRRLRDAGAVNARTAVRACDLCGTRAPELGVLERLADAGLALVLFDRHGCRWAVSRKGRNALAEAEGGE